METSGKLRASAVFVDRTRELRVIEDALSQAGSRVVVIGGEAGIGKTTLLERFLAGVSDRLVLRADGDQSETDIPFAAADQLLRSGGSAFDAMQSAQHVAVGLELVELMTSQPSVSVVDDAHLVDTESLRALLFAARRLGRAPALLILVVPDVLPEGWAKLAEVVSMSRLSPEHVRELGRALGVHMTVEAAARLCTHANGNPLHVRAVLDELVDDATWQQEERPLPAPRSYAELVRARLDRHDDDVVALIEAAAVLGVRAPLDTASRVAEVPDPLLTIDAAIATELVDLRGQLVEFTHPLARAAVYETLPKGRRAALDARGARVVGEEGAALRHRVEAAVVPDAALLSDLEAHARAEMATGAWSSAVSSLSAATRLARDAAERERFAAEAIEATMYSGDGATARRLVAQTRFADGPRRDSVLAYLAIFDGDLATAQDLLARAWERRGDDHLAATVAQRSAFLAASRLRGAEAIEWAERAMALEPGDTATARLVAASLALGLSFTGRREEAHAALDRWLDGGSGFISRTLQGFLLTAEGDLPRARAAFETAAAESLERGLLVVAALSLSGLTRVEYLVGAWDSAVVSSQRAIDLAVESEDQWVIGQAHWRASHVPAARGDWSTAEAHVRAIHDQAPTFERHIAAKAIAAAGVAGARGSPLQVLTALAPLEALRDDADGVNDPAFVPWQHLKAHALVDDGRTDDAEPFIAEALALAHARANPLLGAQLTHARGKLELARR